MSVIEGEMAVPAKAGRDNELSEGILRCRLNGQEVAMNEVPMRICLANVRDKSDSISQPALSLLYLAAYLRERLSFSTEIRIVEDHEPLGRIAEFKPDVVGFTSFSVSYSQTVSCAEAVKQAIRCTTIVGGHHISGAPASLAKAFDFGVMFEGEETLAEVLENLWRGTLGEVKSEVRGLSYHGPDGTIVTTERREAIRDLDSLPLPAFDLVEGSDHMQFNYGTGWKKTVPLTTTRGCPHKCTFCSSSAFWRKVRWLSAERVIESIEELVGKYGITRIQLVDDLFIWPPERFRKVHDHIMRTGLNKRLSFRGAARCDMMTDEVVSMLKDIQFETVGFGIEFGSQRNLDRTNKHAKVEHNRRGLLVCKRGGLDTGSGFIVGVPGESEDDLRETYEFIRDLPIDIPELYLLTPYPGTPLYAQMSLEGTDYQKKRLKDFDGLAQGVFYNGWQLFFAPWQVVVPEIWTNPALTQEIYRRWIMRLLRLTYRRKVNYLVRLILRIRSPKYLLTLARYVMGRRPYVAPEPEPCEG